MRRWWSAALAAVAVALVVGLPTDVVPNPVFGRSIRVTWWSYPVLVVTAVLGGLLFATYVRDSSSGRSDVPAEPSVSPADERGVRRAGIGGLLSFFAVGCPVCNKLVLLALGTTGARQWFEPVQPLLAVASVVLLAVALRGRLRADVCPVAGSSGRGEPEGGECSGCRDLEP